MATGVNVRREWLLRGNGHKVDASVPPSEKRPTCDRETGTDLSWLLEEYSEAALVQKLHEILSDATLPMKMRIDRAASFWRELQRRAS